MKTDENMGKALPASIFTGLARAWFANVKSHPLLWASIASLPIFLFCLVSPGLNDGEAMYAQIAREMRLGGDWITPRLNGTPHFDKPPLLYWFIALSQIVLGESELSTRLFPALAAWGTAPVVGAIGVALYGRRAGWIGALVFAASLGPFLFGRMALPDPSLCFWISLAILGYVKGYIESDGKTGPWIWVMFAAVGFASLIKGVLGLGLPVAIVGLDALLSGRLKRFFTRRMAAGTGVVAAMALPWYVAVCRANPAFFSFFIINEHLLRFTGQRHPRDNFVSLPVFLTLTFLWTFPWCAVAPGAVWRGVKRLLRAGRRNSPDLLPIVWLGFVLALFSASRQRLEYYALPAIPAVSILIGKLWDDLIERGKEEAPSRGPAVALGVMAAVSVMAAAIAFVVLGPARTVLFEAVAANWPESGWIAGTEQAAVLDRIRWVSVATLAVVAFCSAGASVSMRKSRYGSAFSILAAMMVPLFIMVHWGFQVMEPFMSSRAVAEIVNRNARPGDAVVFPEPREIMWVGGIAFYTGRIVTILKDPRFDGVPTKLREPPERFLDTGALMDLWKSGRRVELVADLAAPFLEKLSATGKFEVLGEVGGRVVVSNGGR